MFFLLYLNHTLPFFKKCLKLDYSSYHSISLLSNIEKILWQLFIRDFTSFVKAIILSITYRQQYSASHALINITENIRKVVDDGNITCGVFAGFQKVFDTVDHQILLAKLNPYEIRGVWNDWFKSYLSNRNQYVSINEWWCCFRLWRPSKTYSRTSFILILFKQP